MAINWKADENGVLRDWWKRPGIMPPDWQILNDPEREPYTRATTVAGTLDDGFGLTEWKMRMTALGVAMRQDLGVAVVAARDDKNKLNSLANQAKEYAGASSGANQGTALHSLTEQYDKGTLDLSIVPEAYRGDLIAYGEATRRLNNHLIETFTVCDAFKIAGTPDRVVEWTGERVELPWDDILEPGGFHIGDVKTDKTLDFGQRKYAVQLAIYANSKGYRFEDDSRFDLPNVSKKTGLIAHMPATTGTCHLYAINIAAGWDALQVSVWARAWNKRKDLIQPL